MFPIDWENERDGYFVGVSGDKLLFFEDTDEQGRISHLDIVGERAELVVT